jgi:N-acyl-D-amino-acid deacylase
MFDLFLKNGTIVDGSGKPGYIANIGIMTGKIAYVGAEVFEARETIDASGLTITPGFFDFHSHSDGSALYDISTANMLEQGITTEIWGMCGGSASPETYFEPAYDKNSGKSLAEMKSVVARFSSFIDYVEKHRHLGCNVGMFVGHGSIRRSVLEFSAREPDDEELERMKDYVRDAMEAGALGLSSGLIYPPGAHARERELVEMTKVAGEYGGIYASHIRNEGDRLVEAVEEAIRIAEKAGASALISHYKVMGVQNKGKSLITNRLIAEANARGVLTRGDQYTFRAGMTSICSAIPPIFTVDGVEELLQKIKINAGDVRGKIKAAVENNDGTFENLIANCGGFDGVLICGGAGNVDHLVGKTIGAVARERGIDPFEAWFDIMVDDILDAGGADIFCAYFVTNEEDIIEIFKNEDVMVGTDGWATAPGMPTLHPRGTSTVTKAISEYVREKKLLPLETFVKKGTSTAAQFSGFISKGLISEGYDADLFIFNYEKINPTADYIHPAAPNEGVCYTIVGGQVAVKDGKFSGTRNGKVLRR